MKIPFPDQKYKVILADPAWHTVTYSKSHHGLPTQSKVGHYETMTLEQLKELPVGDLAGRECALFMWVIDSHLDQALELGRSWGFRYSSIAFIWRKMTKHGKDHFGMGKTTRKQLECVLLFMKEPPKRQSAAVRQYLPAEWIDAKTREHSRKPDEQYGRIEALYEGPYCELFARQTREGWSSWGLEVGKFDRKGLPQDILDLLGDPAPVKLDADILALLG